MNYRKACRLLDIKENDIITNANNNNTPLTKKKIQKKYHIQALLYHPDKRILLHSTEQEKRDINERFQQINEAYQYIINNYVGDRDNNDSGYEDDEDGGGEWRDAGGSGDECDEGGDIEQNQAYSHIMFHFISAILGKEMTKEIKPILLFVIENPVWGNLLEKKLLQWLGFITDIKRLQRIYRLLSKYKFLFCFTDTFYEKLHKQIEELIKDEDELVRATRTHAPPAQQPAHLLPPIPPQQRNQQQQQHRDITTTQGHNNSNNDSDDDVVPDVVFHPTLEDLYEKRLFMWKNRNELFCVPLWCPEMVFGKNAGNANANASANTDTANTTTTTKEWVVFCEPKIPPHMVIDDDNNLHIFISRPLNAVFTAGYLMVDITKNVNIRIEAEEIKLIKHQRFVYEKEGIPAITTDVNEDTKMDVFVYLDLKELVKF